jgi:5-methyltetrahydrofolate--homocysteine methyltransferase
MAEYAVMARDAGATIIGGCCGTMPEHLVSMKAALETRPRGERPTLDLIAEKLGAFSSASDGTEAGGAPAGGAGGGRRRSRRRG